MEPCRRQKRVSYRRCFQGPQDPHPTLGATGTAGAAAEPPEPRFPGLRGSGFTLTYIYIYIYIFHFNMECLSLVLITAEKSYELKCQTVKWNASDQFSIVKGEMALTLVLK